MTKSQINKLGEKLRKAFELDTETLLQLQQVRASYDKPMLEAQTRLRKLGFEATSRLKTTNTIIEKLRRERTRLAEMQDIGGLRIVSQVDRSKQDEIVKRIFDVFSITRVRLIEIQVRTQLQDLWAQAMERLADETGRAIRYGGAPQRRREDVESLLNISHEIAEVEVMLTKLNQMEVGLPQPRRAASMQRELRLHIARIQSLRVDLLGRERQIRAMLETLIAREGAPK
jgi:ppGpp synthetase/RelA/SpoT-type nucleotidyltranferase